MIQQLRNFVAVADNGSINRAAGKLFISQQALRASLNALEKKLGFRLFDRTTSGVVLTEAGKVVYDDTQTILQICDGWKKFIEPAKIEEEQIHVMASTIVCNTIIVDLVAEFCKKYPQMRITFSETREPQLLAEFSEHTIGVLSSVPDDAIKNTIIPFAEANSLQLQLVGEDHFCVYLNSKNPLSRHKYLTTDQLKELILAMYPGENERFPYRGIHKYFSPQPPFFIETQDAIFRMISNMTDVAGIFPQTASVNNRYYDDNQITYLPVKDYPMPGTGCILSPPVERITRGEKIASKMIYTNLSALSRRLAKAQNHP